MGIDVARKTHADSRDLVFILVSLDHLAPLLLKALLILWGIKLIGGDFVAVLVDHAMFNVGSAHVKADKKPHLSLPPPGLCALSMAQRRKPNVK